MKTAYIEPSAINWAADLDRPLERLRDFLATSGFEAAMGVHTVYELARTLRNDDPVLKRRGQKLFSILRALDPIYQSEPEALLRGEIEKLRCGTPVSPALGPQKHAALREEVAHLASGGMLSHEAHRFIAEVEKRKEHELKAQDDFLGEIRLAGEADPSIRSLRTFDDVLAYFEGKGVLAECLMDVHGRAVSEAEARELSLSPSSFPASTAAVRANVYLNFIMISKGARPGRDKLDDYKHCCEASYCDAFITADGQQANAMRSICPDLLALKLERVAFWGG